MLSISCFLLVAFWQISDSFKGAARKLRNRDEALTTTEWALVSGRSRRHSHRSGGCGPQGDR